MGDRGEVGIVRVLFYNALCIEFGINPEVRQALYGKYLFFSVSLCIICFPNGVLVVESDKLICLGNELVFMMYLWRGGIKKKMWNCIVWG